MGKFRTTMVEQNFLPGGTEFTPWWNSLILGTESVVSLQEK